MNKEQFKKSILNLISHYVGNMVYYREQIKDIDDEVVKNIIKQQTLELNKHFAFTFDKIIDTFVGDESES